MKTRLTTIILAVSAVCGMLLAACGKDDGRTDGKVYITVKANNDSYGQVTGSGAYDKGADVQIAAYPTIGYHLEKWSDGSTDNPRTIKADADITYTAEFATGGGQQGGGESSGEVTGDGTITVNWGNESWTTTELYAIAYNDGSVTLSLYQDLSNPQSKLILFNMPLAAGTYYATQGDASFMCVLYNYPNESYNYNGQEMPPYQPAQGLYMTVEAIDVEAHRFTGVLSGQFIYMGDYVAGNYNMVTVSVRFSAAQWIDTNN